MATLITIDKERLERAYALTILREARAKHEGKDPDGSWKHMSEIIRKLLTTADEPIRCEKCGAIQYLYGINKK